MSPHGAATMMVATLAATSKHADSFYSGNKLTAGAAVIVSLLRRPRCGADVQTRGNALGATERMDKIACWHAVEGKLPENQPQLLLSPFSPDHGAPSRFGALWMAALRANLSRSERTHKVECAGEHDIGLVHIKGIVRRAMVL